MWKIKKKGFWLSSFFRQTSLDIHNIWLGIDGMQININLNIEEKQQTFYD